MYGKFFCGFVNIHTPNKSGVYNSIGKFDKLCHSDDILFKLSLSVYKKILERSDRKAKQQETKQQ